jgi:hypothetical protein
MAKALFIGWGEVVHGRERQAQQIFEEAIQYWGGLQQQGEIESFDAVGLEPHGGDLAGFFLIRGDPERLGRLRIRDDFQRLVMRGSLVVEDIGVVTASLGDELAQQFQMFQQQVGELAG